MSVVEPRLVVVAGAPATGKTTLARRLGADLGCLVLTKDDIKEAIADALGTGDREWSRRLGRGAYAVLYDQTRRALTAGLAVVIEANFYQGQDAGLRALAAIGTTRIVLCRTEPDARRSRYAGRTGRHGIHLDAEILATEWDEDDEPFVIDVGAPRLIVDTTNGYTPAFAEIVAFVRT